MPVAALLCQLAKWHRDRCLVSGLLDYAVLFLGNKLQWTLGISKLSDSDLAETHCGNEKPVGKDKKAGLPSPYI